MKIDYMTANPAPEYAKAIGRATSIRDLIDAIAPFRMLANDAFESATNMSADEFSVFRRGLLNERSGKFAGEEWNLKYGHILMPNVMFFVSMMELEYRMLFGSAYIRAKEAGRIVESDGIASLVPRQESAA